MEKVREVVDKVIHPKSDTTTTSTTHNTSTGGFTDHNPPQEYGTHNTNTGMTGTGHHAGATGTAGTAGPHNSNMMNKADPRVDSDMDGSRNMGAAQYGPGSHHTTTGAGIGAGAGAYDNAGPHSSNMANKADPRVDSDMDGSRNMGASQYGPGSHNTANTGMTGAGMTGAGMTGAHHTTGSTNAGPHNSNMMNKMDPRVDSDRDASRNMGAAEYGPGGHQTSGHHTTGAGMTGAGIGAGAAGAHHTSGSTNAGPHNSNLMNKMDPRVDSDRDASRNMGAAEYGPGGHQTTTSHHGTTTGTGMTGSHHTTGSSNTTTGPHNSNLLNKLDPRVDSDRDGSRNMGAAQYGPGGHHTGRGEVSQNHGDRSSSTMTSGPENPSYQPGQGVPAGTGVGAHQQHHGGSTNAGPHNSNLLNKLDPRVDSDRDGSSTAGRTQY